MSIQYSPKITTDSLGIYLDTANTYCYSGAGTNWDDLGRSGATGSMVSGFSYDSSSKSFYAATAIGTTPTWVSVAPTISFGDFEQYSMEFVVKLRSNASNTFHSLCGNGATNPWVGIYGNSASWYMFFRESTIGSYSNSATITTYNLVSNWATMCITLDTDRTVRFYLNGSLLSTATTLSNILSISRIAGGYSSGGNSYPFQGYLSVFRTYTKKLSDAEIMSNHIVLASRFGI